MFFQQGCLFLTFVKLIKFSTFNPYIALYVKLPENNLKLYSNVLIMVKPM